MKLGFIGAGNMARAIINGLIAEQKISGEDVYIHSAHKSSYESYAKEKGLNPCESNSDVVKNAEIVFLAVKPIVSKDVLEEVSTEFERKNPVLVSMVTGVSIAELADALHFPAAKIIRIMPNVNVEIGEGMTALKAGKKVTETEFSEVTDLFDSIGKTTEMEEKDFSTFVALAGSSPAYVYLFIDAMSRSGVKYGLSKRQAAQAVLGSALKVLEASKSPMDLVDDVCSPGGTTVAGLLAMEEYGFTTSVIKGLDATVAKDKK
jgi:pyrroline-5-carboxylate reductase